MGVFPMILAGAPAKGRADAPLTVIEFADMECPHCAKQWFALQELVKKHPDRFRVVFRNNPLSNLCQPMMSTPGHKNACRAAIAGQCAYRQGRFWELGDLLFGNQRKLSAEDIQGYAEEVGLDLKAFETCIEAPEVKAQIRHDALFARKVGMAGTPSNLINGLLFPGGLSVTGAELIGTAVLDRLSQSTPPPNRMWTRHEAMLAEVPEPVPPAAGAFRTEAFRAGASRTESSGAEPQPPFELVMVTDPADPSARPLLFSQYRFAQLHVATTRVGLRVRSEPTCQGEVLADNDACRMERLLACALAEEKGGFVAVQLAKIGKDGPGPRLQQLIDSDEAIRACVIGKRGGALLAADAQAIGDAPVGRAWFAGHRFDHTDVLELDRFLAAMLLQRDAASAR